MHALKAVLQDIGLELEDGRVFGQTLHVHVQFGEHFARVLDVILVGQVDGGVGFQQLCRLALAEAWNKGISGQEDGFMTEKIDSP